MSEPVVKTTLEIPDPLLAEVRPRRVIVVDTNRLVYALRREFSFHEQARQAIATTVRNPLAV